MLFWITRNLSRFLWERLGIITVLKLPHHLNYIHLSFQQLKGFFPTLFYLHLKNFPRLRRGESREITEAELSLSLTLLTPSKPRTITEIDVKNRLIKSQCIWRIEILQSKYFYVRPLLKLILMQFSSQRVILCY